MLACHLSELWLQFLELMEKKCSKTEYENWIKPIRVLASEGDLLRLEVPNIFVQEYLLDNYKEDLLLFFPV